MKNRFYKTFNIMMLSVMLALGFVTTAKADIINESVIATPPSYVTGASQLVIFDVYFETTTFEWLDAIEFNPPVGVTLAHDLPSNPGLGKCPMVFGVELPSTSNPDGVAWANPAAPNGGSFCGPYADGIVYSFGVLVTADPMTIGDIIISVDLYGDGFPGGIPTIVSVPVTLAGPPCVITCPPDIVIGNDAGMCGADITIAIPTNNGFCQTLPTDMSGFYNVGTTAVTFTADPGVECTMNVTVNDIEDPVINNCNDIILDLDPGECEAIANFAIDATDNCGSMPASLNQNVDPASFLGGVACAIGNASFLQIYDLSAEGIGNDLQVNNVSLGIWDSNGLSTVTVNIYESNGGVNDGDLTLLGSNTLGIPFGFNFFYDFAVSALVPGGSYLVVEVIVPASDLATFVMGVNGAGFTDETYYSSDACGVPNPITLSSLLFGPYSALITVEGDEQGLNYETLGGLVSGDFFPIGVTDVTVNVTDAAGNSATCEFTVTVNEFPNAVTSITCNDNVQVSLDSACVAIVGADLVLEGGPYGCYDDFIVEIGYPNGTNQLNPPNQLDFSHAGSTLSVIVTDENGNSCWGQLVVEDKLPAELICEDIYTVCSESTEPGAPLADRINVEVEPNAFIGNGPPNEVDILIPVVGQDGATVSDLDVSLDITHTWSSDLTVAVISPSGTYVTLFIDGGGAFGCGSDDLLVTMDDEALNTNFDLGLQCNPIPPAKSGTFQPLFPLSLFDGEDLNGVWTVRVSDLFFLDGGIINSVGLNFGQTGGTVALPIPDGAFYFPTGNNNEFSVIGFDPCGPVTLTYFDNIQLNDCSNQYSEVISRTWSAVDANGNVSDQCIQTIYVERNDLSSLTFPANRDDLDLPALRYLTANACQPTWIELENGYPDPISTGFPEGELCENHQITFDDTEIDICGPGYKLLREWTVVDWCTGEVINHTQIIKVLDDEAPIVVCPPEFTVSSDIYSCGGVVNIPDPLLILDCSETFYTVGYKIADEFGDPLNDQIFYDNVIENPDGSFTIIDLPYGRVWIVYTVYDECGAFTECFTEVDIIDDVPPVAVCDENTVVTLGIDGRAEIFAETFDDGSYDNCELAFWEVRRTSVTCTDQFTNFGPDVVFCCNDLPSEELQVEFRVEDSNGNSNTCIVNVDVQDKLPPILEECPPNVTINCRDDYEDLELTGGPAVFYDNCGHTVDYTDIVNIDQCGEGSVRRTWTATETMGDLTSSCTQFIFIVDFDPFNITDIVWPQQYVVLADDDDCEYNADPSATGSPAINDDVCSLTGVTYEDQEFTIIPGACKKIIRDWSVIDWCRINANDPVEGVGYWTFRQVIEIKNTIDPVIVNCQDKIFDVYETGCGGNIELIAEGEDDCTPVEELVWSFEVDLFNNDTIDFALPGNNASGYYDYGTHRIKWFVEDRCGNIVECEHLFTVRDAKAPTPYCLSSITTVVMENSGTVEIWASDFDLNSEDNCTPREDLLFSFSSSTFNTSRTFSCDDLTNGMSKTIPLEMWVTDEFGNQDFCSIFIDLQDNVNDVCEDMDIVTADVTGFIQREDDEMIEEVEVRVNADEAGFPLSFMTDNDGSYAFLDIPTGNNYNIESSKNTDFINGVSTLDLVLIQKHILGIGDLNSPYKIIAADIDNSESVSAIDLVHLRKLILGISETYPNGQESWRFVDREFAFENPTDPFPFRENISIVNYDDDMYGQDFIGVKIGDVNYSASTNSLNAAEVRNGEALKLNVQEIEFESDEEIKLEFMAADFTNILGYQFTMNFDFSKMEFAGIEAGYLNVSESNFGLNLLNEGVITTSWNEVEAQSFSDDQVLFTLIFKTTRSGNTTQSLTINSLETRAEAYRSDYQTMNVGLEFRTENGIAEIDNFELYQNIPNPFSNYTNINFNLPEEGNVELSIFDVTGKLIYKHSEVYTKGLNTISIGKTDLNATGVMYYQIETEGHTATKKMIGLE